ncbi:MAG: hypothetical protein ACHQK8_02440 [Bacteroidia bacterium]
MSKIITFDSDCTDKVLYGKRMILKRALLKNTAYLVVILLLASCGESVTNVYDYYIKNNIDRHEAGKILTGKSKLLYRHQEFSTKAQLELIAYNNGSTKCLVIGSHNVAKSFYIHDSIYYFNVNDLYSHVRGNDFIRQLGDLSIYFTYVSSQNCEAFMSNIDKLKSEYMKGMVMEKNLSHFDYAISDDVFVSIEKKNSAELLESAQTTLWVNRRKHVIKLDDLIKAMQEIKMYNN